MVLKISRRVISLTAYCGLLTIATLLASGCISWNVHTGLEAQFFPDGKLQRHGSIILKPFETDSLGNRRSVGLDTADARKYVNENYVPPAGTNFAGYRAGADSAFTVSWSIEIENPWQGFSDYKRLTADSSSFSGNQIRTSKNESFFRTDYEYRETFFDAIDADSILANLQRIMPQAEDAFFESLRNSKTPDAFSAAEASRDKIALILDRYWEQLIKSLLYDPALERNGNEYADSLGNEAIGSILSIISMHREGKYASYEALKSAIDAADSEIDKRFDSLGLPIEGAYSIFGNDQFDFTLKLHIPGRIEATNADSVSGNDLEWNFTNNDFRARELLLYARSSEYRWSRLLISIVFVLIFIGLVIYITRRLAASRT